MTLMIGLIVGGLWGRSWLDAAVKALGIGVLLGLALYALMGADFLALLQGGYANRFAGAGLHAGFLLAGALAGFALRKAMKERK